MVLYSIKLRSEQAPRDGESGHDDGHHRHELDEDVQAWAGSVLERVAHGVAHHGGTVYLAALPAEITFFDIFLGIVPGTTGVGHEDSQHETGRQAADQKADDARHAEYQSGNDGSHDGQ